MQTQPWLRQPKESTKAYDAFLTYLFLSPSERSLVLAAQTDGAKPRQNSGKPSGSDKTSSKKSAKARQYETWSAQHNWVARVQAYDDHLAAMAFFQQEEAARALSVKRAEAQKQFLESERQLSEKLLDKISQMLAFPLADKMLERIHPNGEPHVTIVKAAGWNFGTTAKMARVWDILGRAALRLPQVNQADLEDIAGLAVDRVLDSAKTTLKPEDFDALLDELARNNLK